MFGYYFFVNNLIMKKFALLISFIMIGFVFVGCDVSSKSMPKTKEIVVNVCGKQGLIYSQMQKEVAKEVGDIIVSFNETITEEEIVNVVLAVCFKYGVSDNINVENVNGGIVEIKIGDGECLISEISNKVIIN